MGFWGPSSLVRKLNPREAAGPVMPVLFISHWRDLNLDLLDTILSLTRALFTALDVSLLTPWKTSLDFISRNVLWIPWEIIYIFLWDLWAVFVGMGTQAFKLLSTGYQNPPVTDCRVLHYENHSFMQRCKGPRPANKCNLQLNSLDTIFNLEYLKQTRIAVL